MEKTKLERFEEAQQLQIEIEELNEKIQALEPKSFEG
eukprot:CAMPEP_0202980680 /NCGR_PEP_ID=MMETSP1396-20130829/86560_1 /ASSEMBLY_ACC=CAM_ASM_000872 /TAXON_ID= /ORGANISM="Pseudokeronopsis sp., Strain Brazil" /LENGTH=36 /DNA_ID= /DNA_START= /DNA_END= /DNA_ORIENTATION=